MTGRPQLRGGSDDQPPVEATSDAKGAEDVDDGDDAACAGTTPAEAVDGE